jgi:hypothetical protein
VRRLVSDWKDPVQWRLRRAGHRLHRNMPDRNAHLQRDVPGERRRDRLQPVVHRVLGPDRGIAGHVRRHQVRIRLQQRLPRVQQHLRA